MLGAFLAFGVQNLVSVLQLDCAVSDPVMGRAVPCCSVGLKVLGVEPYKGPDRHKSQARAALG